MKRDRFQCTYCGASGTEVELEIDHIIPLAKSGSNHMSNLTTSCRTCNQKKGINDMPIQKVKKDEDWFVHILEDGKLKYQGQIKAFMDDKMFVQLFSFMDGRPTIIRPFDKDLLKSDKIRIYSDETEWRESADAAQLRGYSFV